ncbi:MAG: DUF6382 domain-containing protein [Ruminococcus sp.]|jgi:hypothetical protein
MMEVSYKRDFHHSYLILADEKIPDYDAYPVRMMLNSSVPGLLSCSIHRVDNQAMFYYEITSMQPLASLCESKKINRDSLILVIGALMKTIEEMERYLLNPASLLLQPEFIYVNIADRVVGFCCWPGKEEEEQAFLHFTEFLLPKIDHQDQDAVVLGYQLYRRAMEGRINPEEIRREIYREVIKPQETKEEKDNQEASCETDPALLEEEMQKRREIINTFLKNPEEEKEISSGKITLCIILAGFTGLLCFYMAKYHYLPLPVCIGIACAMAPVIAGLLFWQKIKRRFMKKETKKEQKQEIRKDNLKETEWKSEETPIPDLADDSRTSLLCQPTDRENYGILRAVSPPQAADIILKKGTVILGKLEGAVDIVLPSPAVSRIHAKIKCDRDCEIFDLNSRNGTYVNQIEDVGFEGKKLKEGDMVSFADVVFQYTLPGNSALRIHRE